MRVVLVVEVVVVFVSVEMLRVCVCVGRSRGRWGACRGGCWVLLSLVDGFPYMVVRALWVLAAMLCTWAARPGWARWVETSASVKDSRRGTEVPGSSSLGIGRGLFGESDRDCGSSDLLFSWLCFCEGGLRSPVPLSYLMEHGLSWKLVVPG